MCVTVSGVTDMSAKGDKVVALTIAPSVNYIISAPGGFTLTVSINVLDDDGKSVELLL